MCMLKNFNKNTNPFIHKLQYLKTVMEIICISLGIKTHNTAFVKQLLYDTIGKVVRDAVFQVIKQ